MRGTGHPAMYRGFKGAPPVRHPPLGRTLLCPFFFGGGADGRCIADVITFCRHLIYGIAFGQSQFQHGVASVDDAVGRRNWPRTAELARSCMLLGYADPLAERTPAELIKLMLCHPNAVVEVQGLVGAAHLNGKRGTVRAIQSVFATRDSDFPCLPARIPVDLGEANGGTKLIKHHNLKPIYPFEPFSEPWKPEDSMIPKTVEYGWFEAICPEDYDPDTATFAWEYDDKDNSWTRYPARIEGGIECMFYSEHDLEDPAKHYLFHPGYPNADGMLYMQTIKPRAEISSRQVVFGNRRSNMVECDLFTGQTRPVRRRKRP